MAAKTAERWNVDEIRLVLLEFCPEALILLDEQTRRVGIDPATATHSGLLSVGATLACLALVQHEELPLRKAEAGLTRDTPTMVQRAIARGVEIQLAPEPGPSCDDRGAGGAGSHMRSDET